ncbi:MAG: hypothetical protein H0X12_07530 [Nocardioides sp.]|nr:hypothetical protein [Nocardioides sp.]
MSTSFGPVAGATAVGVGELLTLAGGGDPLDALGDVSPGPLDGSPEPQPMSNPATATTLTVNLRNSFPLLPEILTAA